MSGKKTSDSLATRDLIVRGTIMASIITVPSLITFFVSWVILDDLILAAIIGGVVHFVIMGFSLKISKKLIWRCGNTDP